MKKRKHPLRFIYAWSYPARALVLFAAWLAILQPALSQRRYPYVVLDTTKGQIVMMIYTNIAPRNAASFLDLVSRGFYDGLYFHRVENWVVQGGDPTGTGNGNFVDPESGQVRYLPLEVSGAAHHSAPGVVGMARNPSNVNSASCQFYILKQSQPSLDGKYTIIGGVVKGLDNIYRIQPGDRILSARIAGGGQQQQPRQEVQADPLEPPEGTGF